MADSELLFPSYHIEQAIRRIRLFESPEGYIGGFSGGKDSTVIYHLAKQAGVSVRWRYHSTTIDPPEVLAFIRQHEDVEWIRPPVALLTMSRRKGLPTRRFRWCCEYYKEIDAPGSTVLVGLRAAESPRRAARASVVTYHKRRTMISPIVDWSDAEVWAYLKGKPVCSLYAEGYKRIGCVGCPILSGSRRQSDFQRWPKLGAAWHAAALRTWEERPRLRETHATGEQYWSWWLSDERKTDEVDECQGILF
jgi:phosphoadenosine phosphosulfate reductase